MYAQLAQTLLKLSVLLSLLQAQVQKAPEIGVFEVGTHRTSIIASTTLKTQNLAKEQLPASGIEYVKQLIVEKSQKYGINPKTAIEIARCESRYSFSAKNPTSSAYGIYQIINSTWAHAEKELGKRLERKSWDDQLEAGAFLMQETIKHWDESRHCWNV